ncbi:sca1 complex scaffold protein scaa [Anaeramoeba flamelloides]|uniref:Sca1 complex scaffold protein scaa n=1 Tax=Anaeramoeba flamelloides TaxID=1746091 RepID=A0ABQ8Y7W7_9EUKA|nr:sca1 complex scaffold protein scaa [Anaeramoeba flamelloides]
MSKKINKKKKKKSRLRIKNKVQGTISKKDPILNQTFLRKTPTKTPNKSPRKKKTKFKEYFGINGTYLGPPIITQEVPPSPRELSQTVQFPFYLGSKGEVYDKYYLPINEKLKYSDQTEEEEANTQKQKKKNDLEEFASVDIKELPNFPDPITSTNYEQFEKDALEWGDKIQKLLGYLRLPDIIGSYYNLPTQQTLNDEDLATSETTEWDLISGEIEEGNSVSLSGNEDQEIQKLTKEKKTNQQQNQEETKTKLNATRETSKGNITKESSFNQDNSWGTQPQFEPDESYFLSSYQETALYKYLSKDPNENNEKQIDQNISKFLHEKEQWGSTLVPMEPSPDYYETFEEFERAYRRWTQIVSKNITTVPMHPLQLKKQIKLIPSKLENKKNNHFINDRHHHKSKSMTKSKTQDYLLENNQLEEILYSPKFSPFQNRKKKKKKTNNGSFLNSIQNRRKNNSRVESSNSPILEYHIKNMKLKKQKKIKLINKNSNSKNVKLMNTTNRKTKNKKIDSTTKKNLDYIFRRLYKKIQFNQKYYGSNSCLLLGKLHGVIKGKKYKSTQSTVLSSSALLISELDKKSERIRMDSKKNIENAELEFPVPEYDLRNTIDFKIIKTNKNLIKEYETELKDQIISYKNCSIYSWYNPKKYPPTYHTKKLKLALYLSRKFPNFTIFSVKKLIQIEMFYDSFQKLLKSKIGRRLKTNVGSNIETYSDLFLSVINPKNFKTILFMLEEYNSKLIYSKISLLISLVINSKICTEILTYYLNHKKLKELYYLIFGLTNQNPINHKVFPFQRQLEYFFEKVIFFF